MTNPNQQTIERLAKEGFVADYAAGAAVRSVKSATRLLAPTVLVPVLNGTYKQHGKDCRAALPKTVRSLGGRAVQAEVDLVDKTYNLKIEAVDFPIDGLALTEDDRETNWLVCDGIDLVADVAAQVDEMEVIDAAYGAAGAGEAMLFDSQSDPVEKLDQELLDLARECGSTEFAIGFDPLAWGTFKNHPAVRDRCGNDVSWENSPNLFHFGAEFQPIYTLFDAAPEGLEPDYQFMAPANSVLVVSRSRTPNRRDPSFMKMFRLNPERREPIRLQDSRDGRIVTVQMDWCREIKITNEAGVKRFNVTTE